MIGFAKFIFKCLFTMIKYYRLGHFLKWNGTKWDPNKNFGWKPRVFLKLQLIKSNEALPTYRGAVGL